MTSAELGKVLEVLVLEYDFCSTRTRGISTRTHTRPQRVGTRTRTRTRRIGTRTRTREYPYLPSSGETQLLNFILFTTEYASNF